MIMFFAGILIVYAAVKSTIDAGKTLPAELLNRQQKTTMPSPLAFGAYTLPYVAAYLLYERFPRFVWQFILAVLVFAAIEFILWFYWAIKRLKAEGFPPAYVKQIRRAYSLFGLGAAVIMASRAFDLFD